MKKLSSLVYDFSHGDLAIKPLIEWEFYIAACNALKYRENFNISLVTGPAVLRHLGFARRIPYQIINIYEVDREIYNGILLKTNKLKNVKVHLESIHKSNDPFIDCDLTCVSDITAIKMCIENQSKISGGKAFIWSVSLRNKEGLDASKIIATIFRSIGVKAILSEHEMPLKHYRKATPKGGYKNYYLRQLYIQISGRVINYICYKYDAGGGCMLTCFMSYI